MSLVVLDTDVASALLRRRVPEQAVRQLAGHTLAITFVTIGELTKWTLVRRWGPRRVASVRTFLAGLVVLPYDQHGRPPGRTSGICPTPRPPPARQ